MDFRQMSATVKNQWLVVVICAALGTALFGLFALNQPTVYESQSQVLLSAETTDSGARGEGAYSNALLAVQKATTYGQLAASKSFRIAVNEAMEQKLTEAELEQRLKVEALAETGIIDITSRADSPQEAETLVGMGARQLVESIDKIERETGDASRVAATVTSTPTQAVPAPKGLIKSLVGGAILGLLAGLALVLTLQLIRPKIYGVNQAREVTDRPCLGGVSTDASIQNEVARAGSRARSMEQLRAIRAALEAAISRDEHHVVLVTGPHGGEGATTVAAGLSAVLSDAGRSVVLVDADLRDGGLSQLVARQNSTGLSDVIAGTPVKDAVQSWRGVDVIASGRTDAVPSDLFDATAARRVWSTLRDQYDLVVVDSVALLAYADSHPLVNVADQTVLVVDSGNTLAADLDQAAQLVVQLGSHLAGTVVNRSSDQRGQAGSSATHEGAREPIPT